MTRMTRVVAAAGFAALAMTVPACSGGSARGAAHPFSPSATITPPSPSSEPWSASQLAAIAAYERFWTALPVASRAKTVNGRLAVLVPVTTDPELTQLVTGLGRQRASGRGLYGTNVPRLLKVDISGTRAVVRDCQDSHGAGIVDLKTGDRLTVGVARHLVTSVLVLRDSDWKVSTVQYAPSGTRC